MLLALLNEPALAQDTTPRPLPAQPAQDEEFENSPAEQDAPVLDQIIVTGTSIRGIGPVGSSAVSLGREQLLESGYSNPVDVLRDLPQVQSLGFDETPRTGQNAGGNIQRGSSVNLRGLGSNATLLLIDGRRVSPTGNVFSFTEANQLPVSAIERIEVIADGASAIYGSDAVAGVVNYIPRRRFDGIEVSLRGTTNQYYEGWGASIIAGKDWGSGGFVVAYDHDDRGGMFFGESPYLRQDLRRFGGPDNRVRTNTATSTAPGNIFVPRTGVNPVYPTAGNFNVYGVRPGSSGVNLTAADLLLNQANLEDANNFASFLPETKRHQAYAAFQQDLTNWLELSAFGFFNRRDSVLYSYPQSGVRTLPASSPYYISGIPGVAPGAPLTIAFDLYKDVGIGRSEPYDMQYQGAATLAADLFAGWRGEAGVNLSRNRNCANCIPELSNNIDTVALQAALNNGSYNPFSSTPAPESLLRTILPSGFDRNRSSLNQFTLRMDGPLFQLPGGEVKAAVGAEYLEYTQWRSSIGIRATSDVPRAFASRNIKAAYAELFVPIVGEDFTLPFMQSLLLDVALRAEDYSDVGSTTNPKIGVTWEVINGVELRGAWGTSFRAPNLIENNPEFFSRVNLVTVTNLSDDPAIGLTNPATNQTNVLNVAGSSADLVPETASNYSFGVDLRPSLIPGLSASVTYYNIKYDEQIIGLQGFLQQFLASTANRALYAPYITPAIQPAGCVNGDRSTYNPAYLPALGLPSVTAIDESNMCSARAILYSRNANASSVEQDGIDIIASYRADIGESRLAISGSFTKVLGNETQIVAGGPTIEGVDIINYPVSSRARGSISWTQGPVTITPAVDYVGPYTNNLPIVVNGVRQPVVRIPSWTTFDLGFMFDMNELASWTSDLRVIVNIRNLTNERPPVVLSANGNAMDTQNANPFGRIGTVQITKRF